ncbi:MAG: hypothetical protein ABIT82_05925, partial [Ramlibacter sp.]
MKVTRGLAHGLGAVLLAVLAAAPAAAQALLEVGGQVERPLALSRADLQALARRDYSEQRTV